jgi:hypothetical protein
VIHKVFRHNLSTVSGRVRALFCMTRIPDTFFSKGTAGTHLNVKPMGHRCNSVPVVGRVLGGGPAGTCCAAVWLLLLLLLSLQGSGATAADRRPRRCLLLAGLLLCFCCHSAAAAAGAVSIQ